MDKIYTTDKIWAVAAPAAAAVCLLQIGELVNKLSDDFKARYDEIP